MNKFLILTSDVSSESNLRIKTEIENLGHRAEIKNFQNFVPFISDASGHDALYYREPEGDHSEKLQKKEYAGVVTRIGGAGFEYALYILRQFENLGVFVTCPAFAAENCSDKFRTSQVLSRAKVLVPKQALSWYAKDPGEIIGLVDKKLPVWVKQIRGSKGIGVFQLVEPVSANQTMQSFQSIPLVIQKDLNKHKTGKRSDIRVLCVGPETDKPSLVAYERISESTDTRSNYSIHKSGQPVELTEIEKQDCIKAAKAVGAGISGIDLIRDEQPGSPTEGKTFCIEINQNLGLTGIEEVTRVNCAKIIAEYVVSQSGRRHPNKPFHDMANTTASAETLKNESVFSKIKNQIFPNNQKFITMTESEKKAKIEMLSVAKLQVENLMNQASELRAQNTTQSNFDASLLESRAKKIAGEAIKSEDEKERAVWEDDPINRQLRELADGRKKWEQ